MYVFLTEDDIGTWISKRLFFISTLKILLN